MDPDKLPKKPAVPSQAAADAEFDRWLRENSFDRLTDGDGQVWRLTLLVSRLPEPAAREAAWIMTIHLTTAVTAELLVATKVFDPQADERLIAMLGDREIDVELKPVQHKAVTREDARRLLTTVLPETRSRMESSSFREIKRSLVGRWVDRSCRFGASL
jgi:hypothetical protein